ncbi:MAG: ABC transporter permease [Paenibacillaceae bacterium]
MAILRFLYRKMWNNRWFAISTLLGLTIAVSFTMSIPMYSDGSLKRLVSQTLEQQTNGLPAASLYMKYQAGGKGETDLEGFQDTDEFIREELPSDIGFPSTPLVSRFSIRSSQIKSVDPNPSGSSKFRQLELATQPGLSDLIEITQGRMFEDHGQDSKIEAIVVQDALYRHEMKVGDVYQYTVIDGDGIQQKFQVEIVGAYDLNNERDPAWVVGGQDLLLQSLMVSDKSLNEQILKKLNIPLSAADWYYAFDLQNIRTSNLSPLIRTLDRLDITLFQKLENTHVSLSFLDMLYDFRTQSIQMQAMLFALAAPMIAMVFYFIAMNARQSLDRQRGDIAVLKSRGGSTRQVIWLYTLEGLLLGGCSLILGTAIGWFLAKSIGSSSGFLSFVGRKVIPIDFSWTTLFYGLLAVSIAIGASVVPVAIFARSSIVSHKRNMARSGKPFWQRYYLDLILLLTAVSGWYMFNSNRMLSASTGLSSDQLQVQPLLFFVPALSIFALGLVFLRLFPWLLTMFHRLGRTFMPVTLHLTLTQLSRSANSYYPIMILLLLTLGLGVYNSSAARTIDMNTNDRTLYQYGTDVVIQTVWEGYQDQNDESIIYYSEPSFEPFRQLDEVEAAARVLKTSGKVTVSGKSAGQGQLIGIDNVDFSKVAWFRSDLYPVHPNVYLDLLSYYEQAVLISSSFAEKYQLEEGDLVTLTVGVEQAAIEFIVVGIVPYWPSLYPKSMPFFISNLDYINNRINKIPYEVWLKMEDGAKVTPIVEKLAASQIEVSEVRDVRNALIDQINHPSRGGVFGILSLGFIVSMLISLIGYILYWFFTLSGRVVQFGILRAMGLQRGQLTSMLLMEQLLTTGLSIALGIGLGKLSSYVFLPFLQTAGDSANQIPPFRIVFEAKDTVKLYSAVGVMMLIGVGLLFMQIRKLRVHEAVKLGEER